MKTTQTQQKESLPFAFRCTQCNICKVTEGSKMVQFEDGTIRICKDCVQATEYLRDRLPIVGE